MVDFCFNDLGEDFVSFIFGSLLHASIPVRIKILYCFAGFIRNYEPSFCLAISHDAIAILMEYLCDEESGNSKYARRLLLALTYLVQNVHFSKRSSSLSWLVKKNVDINESLKVLNVLVNRFLNSENFELVFFTFCFFSYLVL